MARRCPARSPTAAEADGAGADEPYLTCRSRDHRGPEVVPAGTYFVMGDRRDNSSASRHWGFVPRESVLGRVTARWWPLSARRDSGPFVRPICQALAKRQLAHN